MLPSVIVNSLKEASYQPLRLYIKREEAHITYTCTHTPPHAGSQSNNKQMKCTENVKIENCHWDDSHHKESEKDKWRDLLKPKVNKRNQALNIQVITDVMTWHLLWHAFETGTLKDIHHLTGITVPPGKKDSHFDECVSHSEVFRQARSQAPTFRNNSCLKNYKWNIWISVWRKPDYC